MQINKQKIIVLQTLLWTCLFFTRTLQAEIKIQTIDFDPDKWVDSFQSISFRLNRMPDPSKGRLVFMIESNDVTALMKQVEPAVFKYQAHIMPLPVGENTLNIFLVHDKNEWTELNSMTLRVLTAGGYEQSEITSRVDISGAFQTAKTRSESTDTEAQESDWVSHNEVSLQAGLSTSQQRDDMVIRSNWNISGSSVQEQALRYSEKNEDASKIDLSDYLIEVNKGDTSVQLGHVTYGSHPLLMSGVSNRGISTSWKAFDRFDMSLSAQNGQSITGGSNLLGFNDYDKNRINGLGFGFDVLPDSKSQLRVEFTYVDAKITAEDNFNLGEVTDAELSSGLGIVISGNNASGRLRGSIAFARSTFQNPVDPFLQQDLELLESAETTDTSRSVNIEYDVLQASYDTDSTALSLTASLTHSVTDPFYDTAGAFVTPDNQLNGLALSGQIGDIGWQLNYNRTRDNLDDIETVLTTLNRNTIFSITLPFKSIFESDTSWLPENISLNYQKNHQFGDNLPPTFDPDSHIPDQVTLQNSLGLDWQIGQTSLAYSYTNSDQDNRQTGRENADFINTENSISVNTSISEKINMNISMSHSVAEDVEQLIDRTTQSSGLGVDWAINELLSLSLNFNKTEQTDSENLATNDSHSAQAQLSYNFLLPGGRSGKLPVQVFMRYSSDKNTSVDNQFLFSSSSENQAINAGLNISFF